MTIGNYRFGALEIDGRVYHSDVLIILGHIEAWWRAQSHSVAVSDLRDALDAAPEVLVVGTGYFGRMVVPEETRHVLEAQGIHVHQARTKEAVEEFNRLQHGSRRLAGAFHLTC